MILVTDKTPEEAKALMELKARKAKPASATETASDRVNGTSRAAKGASTSLAVPLGETFGAEEAAGVLTAIDEGGEGEEEAEVPRDFDYHSDAGED